MRKLVKAGITVPTILLVALAGFGLGMAAEGDLNERDLNGQNTLNDRNGRLPKLLKSIEDDRELIVELYLTALSRFPTDEELKVHLRHVAEASSRVDGMTDVLWTLLNVREFVFVH